MRVEAANLACAVCGHDPVETVAAFERLPRVTSDCRPFPAGGRLGMCPACGTVQKPADAQWQADAGAIYARYDMFRQAESRAEQAVFDQATGAATRRSAQVLARLNAAQPFGPAGRMLDVGCGNGPTLRAMAELAPGWELYGHEISDANADLLHAIPGFRRLYTGDPAAIADRFDLIALSQSLEHLPDPVAGLAGLRARLSPGGRLLVQVPNARANVYDLLVADHRSHFDPRTLAACAERGGFADFAVFDDWVFKELTMVASDGPLAIARPPRRTDAPHSRRELEAHLGWLAGILDAAAAAARAAAEFGVFGTSIAGTWLFGAMSDRVSFFVDEDKSRIGRRHEDRPILAPAQVPRGAIVFVPLVPAVAAHVAARLGALGVRASVPPPFPG